jgi:predicted HAD superfamily Cof-like phosphohydrolase
MTIIDDDESLAYEIIKALEWEDLTTPIQGIPKVTRLLKKNRKPTLHEQVLAFHNRFGQSIGEKPHEPDEKTMRFRLSLITEEFRELLEAALCAPNGAEELDFDGILEAISKAPIKMRLSEFVDALADLAYVMEGTAITMGVDMTPIAAEVQRANMAKLPSYVAEKDAMHQKVITTVSFTPAGTSVSHVAQPVKREDGKIMKPPGWTPPDIEGELKKQGWEP